MKHPAVSFGENSSRLVATRGVWLRLAQPVPAVMSSGLPMIDASPTKEFFISMLTRDVQLTRAIIDLQTAVIAVWWSTDRCSDAPSTFELM
jgi:hypothetical protein